MINCDCNERFSIDINSIILFKEMKYYFQEQVDQGIFVEVPVEIPHYIGYDINGNIIKWYANRWYKCKCCGSLWEFDYPDFPAEGFVRKFEDGVYRPKE